VRSNCEHGHSRATSTARPSRSCRALTPVGRSKRVSALPVPMHEQIIFRGATGQNCRFKSLPATSGLPPSTDIIRRCDWSGWCKKRKIARTANATSLSGKAASVPCKLPGKVPAGQISAFVVQPLLKKYSDFQKTQISLYLSPSRPTQRGVSRSSRTLERDAMDATASGAQGVAGRVLP